MLQTSIFSSYIIEQIVGQIIDKTEQQISQREFVRENMNSYCSNRVISLVNQLGDQLLTQPSKKRPLVDEKQPIKLYGDTMMAMTNVQQVQQNQTVKQQSMSEHKSAVDRSDRKINKKPSHNSQLNPSQAKSQASMRQKHIKQQGQQKLMKLKQQIVDVNIDQQKQIANKRKQKQQQQRQENFKNNYKSNNKSMMRNTKNGMNFDYDGKLIQVRSDKKNVNLVSKVIVAKVPPNFQEKSNGQQLNILKQSKIPTYVQTFQVHKQQQQGKVKKSNRQKTRVAQKKQQIIQIEFSKIQNPLQNIDVKKGVKATFDKNIIQQKEKQVSLQQLKKTITNRKLSKNQYARIKTATTRNSPALLQPNIQARILSKETLDPEPQSLFPSRISSMRKKRSVTQFDEQKIQIKDESLKNYMIQKMSETYDKKEVQKLLDIDSRPCSEQKQKQKLNKIDQYNLDYTRNKTQYQNLKKISDNNILFPKLQALKNPPQPKIRQKLKDGSVIRRDLSKKFQQTLRV